MRSGTRAPRGYLGILVLICAKAGIGRALAANPAMKLRREEMGEHPGISLSLKIDSVTFYALSPILRSPSPNSELKLPVHSALAVVYERDDVLVLFARPEHPLWRRLKDNGVNGGILFHDLFGVATGLREQFELRS